MHMHASIYTYLRTYALTRMNQYNICYSLWWKQSAVEHVSALSCVSRHEPVGWRWNVSTLHAPCHLPCGATLALPLSLHGTLRTSSPPWQARVVCTCWGRLGRIDGKSLQENSFQYGLVLDLSRAHAEHHLTTNFGLLADDFLFQLTTRTRLMCIKLPV